MVSAADFISSAVAWNRVKSPSAGSFTFDILKTLLLDPVINKGKPSWPSLNKTPIKLKLLATVDLTRFAKLSITSVMPITILGPSGTSRQGTEIPHGKTLSLVHRGLALSLGRPNWWDFKCIAACFIVLELVQPIKPKLHLDFSIMMEQEVRTSHGSGGSSGSCTCPVWLCTHDFHSFPICKKVIRAFYWAPGQLKWVFWELFYHHNLAMPCFQKNEMCSVNLL